ncbi:carbon-phosphorus lyase complex subunit PhnI [Candidatus Pelagisphaera phototrophica]|uniref:carbon-phosphorus lyase complex subunit PhnI n=1 Tax=Candidatus Pelagisphaera phototrophica TaxID=2684113 RepID=UPI0024B7952D|nr:carbon-phosphorus lyase complex subunit PhnI [Candidatus Pelagisphaera phototrophica]QXD31735.1 carbon-phosphorus lyase complex subunit PhnI [Candidatus Pelagisphaera phototrophica]
MSPEDVAAKAADKLCDYHRADGANEPIDVEQICSQMKPLVDRVMGEAGLYAPLHAAIAVKQSNGDIVEASEILRSYRQTISRKFVSLIIDTEGMDVRRRISSAFRDIPGGQILGSTGDYTQRLLEEQIAKETRESTDSQAEEFEASVPDIGDEPFPKRYPRVVALLKDQGMMAPVNENESREVVDILKTPLSFPAPRSAALQSLARSETGGLMALGYSAMRGQGGDHPTIGELRVGYVNVQIEEDPRGRQRSIGRIRLTESANISKIKVRKKDPVPYMSLGYGLCFGQNETKAICMGIIDRSNRIPGDGAPAVSQEFSMYHLDGPDAKGYTNSLKIPNYVEMATELHDLRAALERKNRALEKKGKKERAPVEHNST